MGSPAIAKVVWSHYKRNVLGEWFPPWCPLRAFAVKQSWNEAEARYKARSDLLLIACMFMEIPPSRGSWLQSGNAINGPARRRLEGRANMVVWEGGKLEGGDPKPRCWTAHWIEWTWKIFYRRGFTQLYIYNNQLTSLLCTFNPSGPVNGWDLWITHIQVIHKFVLLVQRQQVTNCGMSYSKDNSIQHFQIRVQLLPRKIMRSTSTEVFSSFIQCVSSLL